MVIPVLETWTAANSGGSTVTSLELTKPSGVATGDLLLLILGDDTDGNNGMNNEWTTPSSPDVWEYDGHFSGDGTSDASISLYWRISDGAEPSTITVSRGASDEVYGWYIRVSGTSETNPFDAFLGSTPATGSTYTIAGVTTTGDDRLIIAAVAQDGGDGGTFTIDTGVGWSITDQEWSGTTGNDATGIFAQRNQASSGTGVDLLITSGVTDGKAGFQIAIKEPASVNILTADDVETGTEVGTPVIGVSLTADDVESGSEVTQNLPIGQLHKILADDVETASEVTSPVIGVSLTADDVESGSEVTKPGANATWVLTADDVETASEVTSPVIGVSLTADDVESASEVTSPTGSLNVYTLAPDADVTVGNWTDEGDASINLYQSIDENPANDSDYIQSELDASASIVKIRLSDPADTVDGDAPHTVRYRYRKNDVNSKPINLTVRLIQGASTVIATWTHSGISSSIVEATQTLTVGQRAAISNYSDLNFEFEADTP